MNKVQLILISLFICLQIILCLSEPAHSYTNHSDKIKVWLGGDVHFGNLSSNPLKSMVDQTGGGIGIVNLEGPIHEDGGAHSINGRWLLFNPPHAAKYLKEAGVRIISIANNHQKDAGDAGLRLTEAALKDAGILPVGGSDKHVRMNIGGVKVSVAHFDLTDGLPKDAGNLIDFARREADVLIVTFHTNSSPSYLPNTLQRTAADMSIKAGADVVVFHGSHMLGPVERRGNKVIAWGLGNIVFNCKCTNENEAMILDVTIYLRKGRNTIESCVIPVEAGLNGTAPVIPAKVDEVFDLLQAIGSPALMRKGHNGCF